MKFKYCETKETISDKKTHQQQPLSQVSSFITCLSIKPSAAANCGLKVFLLGSDKIPKFLKFVAASNCCCCCCWKVKFYSSLCFLLGLEPFLLI